MLYVFEPEATDRVSFGAIEDTARVAIVQDQVQQVAKWPLAAAAV